jgi:thioredoxin reductase (NADPH)
MEEYDIIVIGGGPAGLSAGLYAARANKRTLILDKPGEGALKKVKLMENYLGFPEGISGEELLELGRRQVKKFGAELLEDEAVAIKPRKDGRYMVETPEKEYVCQGLIIATGVKHARPKVKNLRDYEGRGVSYCVTCDGFFFRDAEVGVLGSMDYAAKEAIELLNYTKKITLFTNGEKLRATESLRRQLEENRIEVVENRIAEALGKQALEGLKLETGEVRKLRGLFIAVGTMGAGDFARYLGLNSRGATIVVDQNQSTGVPRVYAAGDCTGGNRQVAIAVGEGANAAINLISELRGTKYVDYH